MRRVVQVQLDDLRAELEATQKRLDTAYEVNRTCRELVDLQRSRIRELESLVEQAGRTIDREETQASSTPVLPRAVPVDPERSAQRRCQHPNCSNSLQADRLKYCSNRCAVSHRWDVARGKSLEATA